MLVSLVLPAQAEPSKLINTVASTLSPQDLMLSKEEQAWITAHPVVRVSVKEGWMPVEFKLESANYRGISMDYLNLIAQLTGLKFMLESNPSTPVDTSIDLISSVNASSPLPKGFQLLQPPQLMMQYALYRHRDAPEQLTFDHLRNHQPYRLAIFKHNTLSRQLLKQYPYLQLIHVENADQAFEYLKTRQVDAYIGNEVVVDYHIAYHRVEYVVKQGQIPYRATIAMAVNEQSPTLMLILQKAMQVIGTNRPEIIKSWQVQISEHNWWLMTGICLLLLLLLLVLFYFYRTFIAFKRAERQNRQRIWYQANYDFLTDLPNRFYFHSHLEQAIQTAHIQRQQVAVLTIDLDGFKDINDTAGHSVGDLLLKEVASRMRQAALPHATVARQGGDEFVILVPTPFERSQLENMTQQILHALQQPYVIELKQFYLSASIGIAIYPDTCTSAEVLMIQADQAMYEAKWAGKNQLRFFTSQMLERANQRLSLINDLREAIQQQSFYMEYQPIFDLRNDRMVKAEALVRWRHPIRGQVPPDQFIALAEECGLMLALGRQIFANLLVELPQIQQAFSSEMIISINVSPLQFLSPASLDEFIRQLPSANIDGGGISIEMTEGMFMKPTITVDETIQRVRDAGIKLAIDDFGTGYSVFAYLKKYKFNYLKIDKSFVSHLGSDLYDYILCKSIIQMAHQMNILVVAEGVETSQHKDGKTHAVDSATQPVAA